MLPYTWTHTGETSKPRENHSDGYTWTYTGKIDSPSKAIRYTQEDIAREKPGPTQNLGYT